MSILPGQWRAGGGEDHICNECECGSKATEKVAAEVDSFGVEWEYYCSIHVDAVRERQDAVDENYLNDCDHCSASQVPTKNYRDPEESSGPVYSLCATCLKKARRADEQHFLELEEEVDNFYR